jgi:hypothetical protein
MSKTHALVAVAIVGIINTGIDVGAQRSTSQAAESWREIDRRIDGSHLKAYVDDYAAISRHYRDQNHQFWGRIIGTEGDSASRKWVLEKFRAAGLRNIREQEFDLPPQWLPQSWSVSLKAQADAVELASAQPTSLTPATPAGGVDLEAAYVGLGSDAEFAGRDVRGKAVFVYSVPLPSMLRHTADMEGALKRAEQHGAAAIFIVLALPGNVRTQMYPQRTAVPTFSIGLADGMKVKDAVGRATAGPAPRISIKLDTRLVPNLKTATVWAELPGDTDENVVLVAHRDGWFEGGADNASGIATMLGLAEYLATLSPAQRHRKIVFAATAGHHNIQFRGDTYVGGESTAWIAAHKELFDKTSLIINCEHTAVTHNELSGDGLKATTLTNPLFWYVGGSSRLLEIATRAFDRFKVPRYVEGDKAPPGEIGRFYQYAPSIQLIDIGMLNHSDHETAAMIPAEGLAATTKAYAEIIIESARVALRDLMPAPRTNQ